MKFLRVILLVFILVPLLYVARTKVRALHVVPATKTFSLTFSPGLSEEMIRHIKLFAREHEKISTTPQFFCSLLKEQFPFIEKVTFKSHISGKTHVSIKSAYPIALVNDMFALTSNNQVVERRSFCQSELDRLPLFHAGQGPNDGSVDLPERAKNFMRTCDRDLFKLYDIRWVNETLILLKDTNYPQVTLLIDDTTQVLPAMQKAYAHVREKIVSDKAKKGRNWFVDARFRNQMIVFQKGERG